MERNKVIILKKDSNRAEIIINGQTISRVLDFTYKKSSAAEPVELTLKIDVDEILEVFK